MIKHNGMNTQTYLKFITDLKKNILQSRYQAARLANKEQLLLYLRTGRMLSEKVKKEKWGAKVLERISSDLQKELPDIRGFSFRNLKKMKQFYESYKKFLIEPSVAAQLQTTDNQHIEFRPSATAQFQNFFEISFTHHILILNKCNSDEEKIFFISMSAKEFWSVGVLEHKIDSSLFEKQGRLPNNFSQALPDELKPSAVQIFNDEYLMDYMNLGNDADEREVENRIVTNIRDFILRIGKGFSFIGNQFRVELGGEEFFIDLLFFNRHLQCLVAFELKSGKFKPDYVGQLNFYLNVLDEKIRLPHENPSIGIVLCKEKNNTVVEYSVRAIDKPVGVATFRTTKEIPKEIKDVLPDPEALTKLL